MKILGLKLEEWWKNIHYNDTQLAGFINSFDTDSMFVVGGAIRSIFFDKQPRDIDIMFDGSDDMLNSIILDNCFTYTKNRFGGFKVHLPTYSVDIWSVYSTWAMNYGQFLPVVQNFPKSVFLNMDAIMWNVGTGKMYNNGFIDAIMDRKLDIIYEPNPYPALCAKKAIELHFELGFSMSDRLLSYVLEHK